jgi:hypothetical protein
MKPSPEQPVSFLESLPVDQRTACWLPRQTISLTGPLPHGVRTEFTVRWNPQQRLLAHNVGQVATQGDATG